MKKIFLSIFSLFLFIGYGCNLDQTNINPNSPTQVPLNTLLPPAQAQLANVLGGAVFRYTNIFSSHARGAFAQELDIENYNPSKTFVGYVWEDIYNGPLINLQTVIAQANASQSPHYSGVARVLMANALGTTTEMWGDIPYSEALDKNNLNPKYDAQETVYNQIQGLLDLAITDLSATESVYSPSSDDLIYGGDLNSWKRAAVALKARYLLHLSKRRPDVYAQILPLLSNGLASSSDDMEYIYPNTSTEPNPIYQYYKETPNMLVDSYFKNLLNDDPRRAFLIKRKPFSADTIVGEYYGSIASAVPYVTYIEQKLIEAECLLNTGGNAQTALSDAVRSSIKKISNNTVNDATIDTYINNYATLTGNTDTDLNTIITQKYIALFTQSQPWVDYRRTNLPALTPNPNGTTALNPSGQIPRRMVYPEQEELNNANFPASVPNMQTRFWWDVE